MITLLNEEIKEYHDENNNTIIIGDFNAFAKKDNEVKKLEIDLEPYFLKNCAKDNDRLLPTYHHSEGNTGIDDFCFASAALANVTTVTVSGLDEKVEYGKKRWHGLSDHCPIMVDIGI